MLSWTPGTAPFGRMDALSKLFWVFCVGILSFTQPAPLNLALYAVLILIAVALVKADPRRLVFAIAVTGTLGLFFLGGAIWYSAGTTLLQFGPLRITDEGLAIRAANAFRLMNVMLASFIFIWATNPRDLVLGFIRLGMPYRIAYTIYVGLNYIPIMQSEMGYIRDAQRLRGVRRTGPLEAIRAYPRFALAVFARALRRAEITAYALDSKAFGAYRDRTYLRPFRWSTMGVVWLIVWIILVLAELVVGYGLGLWSPQTSAGLGIR